MTEREREVVRPGHAPGHGEVPSPDGMGDADGIGGTSGAVARDDPPEGAPARRPLAGEGDLPGELGHGAGESSRVR